MYGFDDFVADVKWRIRFLGARVTEPTFTWPGLLILDVRLGLTAEAFAIGPTSAERERLVGELVARIRDERPRRFCFAMPCERDLGGERQECLLLIFGEKQRVQASLGVIERYEGRAPRLGSFSDGPWGSGARRISGRFVEALLEALNRS